MLTFERLQQFTKEQQTDLNNILREYYQHLFLSSLYQTKKSEKLLFKGGTALRIIYASPRFSEDLDFTGIDITSQEIENILTSVLAGIELTGIDVDISESKKTSGGYLAIFTFKAYHQRVNIQLEVSFRKKDNLDSERTVVQNIFTPSYTLVQLSLSNLIEEKIQALFNRQKPRDFYDFFFLLSNNYPQVKEKATLVKILDLMKASQINFKAEFRKFLPISHYQHLKNFPEALEQKIKNYL